MFILCYIILALALLLYNIILLISDVTLKFPVLILIASVFLYINKAILRLVHTEICDFCL